jgi:uncharacterized membrane protein
VKSIAEMVVRVFDLVEAEGRTLLAITRAEGQRARSGLMALAVVVALLIAAVPLVLTGVWFMCAGMFWGLEGPVGRAAAAALTGFALLVLVAGVGMGVRVMNPGRSG